MKVPMMFRALGVGLLGSCTGMLHVPTVKSVKEKLDGPTSANVANLYTVSSYQEPTAEWIVVDVDEAYGGSECLVESTNTDTGEVEFSGIWHDCESPYDLTEAAGIDVVEGFEGLVRVRSFSASGQAGDELSKPFRRGLWPFHLDAQANTVVSFSDASEPRIAVGGSFTGFSTVANRVAVLTQRGNMIQMSENFAAGFNNAVYTAAVQDDGKILVGGTFTSFNGSAAAPDMMVRLNSDGTIDSTFSGLTSGFNSWVSQMIVMDDGRILVGGNFQSYNGVNISDYLVRLNSDGTVDPSFNGITSGFNVTVNTVALQADGKILVGGAFTSFNGSAGAPDYFIRLNSNGSVDSSFTGLTTGFDNTVRVITLQPDGKILVGGDFTTYNGSAAPDGLLRLNSDGTIDSAFSGLITGFDSGVRAVVLQDDGKILVGGNFGAYNGVGTVPDRFIRLNSDGTVDGTFSGLATGFEAWVTWIFVQPDQKIFVCGNFSTYNGVDVTDRLIRLNSDGTVDSTFDGFGSGFAPSGCPVTVLGDELILFVGDFSSYNADSNISDRFGYFTADGAKDSAASGIMTGLNGSVEFAIPQADGKMLVGGNFTSFNGNASAPDRLVRLSSDGSLDASFNAITTGFNDWVRAIAIQGDGKILVGGDFTSYNGSAGAPDRLIRLNSDGSVDASFSGLVSGFNAYSRSIVVQSDGKILVGGGFSSYNGSAGAPDGLIRLNTDGSVDSTFSGITTGFGGGDVEAVALQPDGKILVGGWFGSYNGDSGAPDRFIRLNTDGTIDSSFTGLITGFDVSVEAIVVQPDGKILVGGWFNGYNGSATAPDKLIRLNQDGSVDSSFRGIVEGFNGWLYSISLQLDGKIIVGGSFQSYNNDTSAPDNLLRLNPDGSLDRSFFQRR